MAAPPLLDLHGQPRVVGTLCTLPADLDVVLAGKPCDVVELRVDHLGESSPWVKTGEAIQERGFPVIVTPRLANEGGRWDKTDPDRLPLFEQAAARFAAVDVELRSALAPRVCKMAAAAGCTCIVSYHDFDRTPSVAELETILLRAAEFPGVFKIATYTKTEADVAILESILERFRSRPLCVLGMGPFARQTRLTFPKQGSCLTYGYLDQPAAPGQLSAKEIKTELAKPDAGKGLAKGNRVGSARKL